MKKTKILLFVLLLIGMIPGCDNTSLRITQPSNHEIEKIKPIGDKIAKDLITSLQGEMMKAVKEGGFENAVNVCNLKAISLTDIAAQATDKDVEIKRTTNKYRNPQNAPNDIEQKALNYYHSLLADNQQLTGTYIQKVEENEITEYYYYKPMKVNGTCISCHGEVSQIKSDVLNEINKLYPDDKATGYKEGDFRGLIRIKISE